LTAREAIAEIFDFKILAFKRESDAAKSFVAEYSARDKTPTLLVRTTKRPRRY